MKYLIEQEERVHGSRLVPYAYYNCYIPVYFSNVPLHWHSEFEINYVIEGKAMFRLEDEEFVSEDGDIILVQPDSIHSIYPLAGSEQRYDTIVFHGDFLGASSGDRCAIDLLRPIMNGAWCANVRITKEHPYYEDIKRSVEQVFHCINGATSMQENITPMEDIIPKKDITTKKDIVLKEDTALKDLHMKCELLNILHILIQYGDIYKKNNIGNSISNAEKLRPVLIYMNENYSEKISIAHLATMIHLSEGYFISYFKKTVGITAIEYINQLRVKAACEQLRITDKTVLEISQDCGFTNLSNFNRQFKRITGYKPLEYRHRII